MSTRNETPRDARGARRVNRGGGAWRMIRFYWRESRALLALTPIAGTWVEDMAAGYNGYWSWAGFLLVTATCAGFVALLQATRWLLDHIGDYPKEG